MVSGQLQRLHPLDLVLLCCPCPQEGQDVTALAGIGCFPGTLNRSLWSLHDGHVSVLGLCFLVMKRETSSYLTAPDQAAA